MISSFYTKDKKLFITDGLIPLVISLAILGAALLPVGNASWLPRYFQPAFGLSLLFLALGGISITYTWIQNKTLSFTKVDAVMSLLVAYVLIRYLTTAESHWTHGTTVWMLGLALAYVVFRNIWIRINEKALWTGLVLLALAQVVIGLLQLYGVLDSYHSSFKITGTFFNPALYAGFLVMLFPLALYKMLGKDKKIPHWQQNLAWITAAVIMLVVIPARSRAAWVALAAGGGYLMLMQTGLLNKWQKLRRLIKALVLTMALTMMTIGAYGIYPLKPDSTDGRLLIWKVSANMLQENPLFGRGFARFAPEYMLAQGDYFANGHGTEREEMLAGQVGFAYNEYLQVAVELGLVGVLLFGILIAMALFFTRDRDTKFDTHAWRATLVAWLAFANFSYPMYSWALCLLLVLTLAQLSTSANPIFALSAPWTFALVSIIVLSMILGGLWHYKTILALAHWKKARAAYNGANYSEAVKMYDDGFSGLSHEGVFLQQSAKALQEAGDYATSNQTLLRSKRYYNDPVTYTMMGENYTRLKDYDHAEDAFTRSWSMVPHRMWPRYLMVNMLYEKGERRRCQSLAKELMNAPVKIESSASQEMMNKLRLYAAME